MDECIADEIVRCGLKSSVLPGTWRKTITTIEVVDSNRRFVDALRLLAEMHQLLPLSRAATVYSISRILDTDCHILQRVWHFKSPSWIIHSLVTSVCRTYADGYPVLHLGNDVAMYSPESLIRALSDGSLPTTVDVVESQSPWLLQCGTIQYKTDCPYVAITYGFILRALYSMAVVADSLDEDIACALCIVQKWNLHLPLTASGKQWTVDAMMTTLTDMNRLRMFQCTPRIIIDCYSHVTAAVVLLSRECAAEQLAIIQRQRTTHTQLLTKVSSDKLAIERYTAAKLSDAALIPLDEMAATIDTIYGK